MLIRIYGIMDMIAGLTLLLVTFELAGWRIPFFAALYLLVKGLAYWGSTASFLDFIFGIYIIIALFFPVTWLSIVAAIFLVFKGGRSMF